MKFTTPALLLSLLLIPGPALADSARATCAVQPAGAAEPGKRVPCLFYQAQGHVVITLENGAEYDLTPAEGYGAYVDAEGRPARRLDVLGDRGNAYELADATIYVYW